MAYKKRWEKINACERAELRNTSLDVKLRQIAALMASVDDLGWRSALEEGVEEVRERWKRLRKLHGV